jgi:hypothetical protein
MKKHSTTHFRRTLVLLLPNWTKQDCGPTSLNIPNPSFHCIILAFFAVLKLGKLVSSSKPLHWLFPLGMLCHQIFLALAPSCPSAQMSPFVRPSAHSFPHLPVLFSSAHLALKLYNAECTVHVSISQSPTEAQSPRHHFKPHHDNLGLEKLSH